MKEVSVIIPTYNGAHKITNVLLALEKQSYKDFKVVVVVDGSTDNTLSVLAAFQANTALNLRVVSQPNGGRSVSRNRGVKEAPSNLLIFFDDDMRPAAVCVERHVEHHLKVKHTIAVGAQMEDYQILKTDIQRYKAHLSRKWSTPLEANGGLVDKNNPFITAANFSVSRELFFQLGGFDERLTDAEDFDLAVRAAQLDIPIYFKSEAIAWHDDFITCRSYIHRLRQYHEAHRKLRCLKPDLYRHSKQYQYNSVRGIKKTIYNMLASREVVNRVDQNAFSLLPKRIKYKIYDIVTTGLSIHFPDRSL